MAYIVPIILANQRRNYGSGGDGGGPSWAGVIILCVVVLAIAILTGFVI